MKRLLRFIAALFRRDDCRNCAFLRNQFGSFYECDQLGSRAYQGPRDGLVNIGQPYTAKECGAWRAKL